MCSVNLSTSKHPSSLSPRSSPPPAWYEGYSFSCLSNLLPHPRARRQHQDAYQVHPDPKSGRQNPPRQVVQQLRGRGEAKAHRRGSRSRHGYVRLPSHIIRLPFHAGTQHAVRDRILSVRIFLFQSETPSTRTLWSSATTR